MSAPFLFIRALGDFSAAIGCSSIASPFFSFQKRPEFPPPYYPIRVLPRVVGGGLIGSPRGHRWSISPSSSLYPSSCEICTAHFCHGLPAPCSWGTRSLLSVKCCPAQPLPAALPPSPAQPHLLCAPWLQCSCPCHSKCPVPLANNHTPFPHC